MHQIYVDEGLIEILIRLASGDITFGLFTNDVTPDRDTVMADLTLAAWAGYTSVPLTGGDFPNSNIIGHQARIWGPGEPFNNFSGVDQVAYGYYLSDNSETMLFVVSRFDDAPVTIPDGGQLILQQQLGNFSRYST